MPLSEVQRATCVVRGDVAALVLGIVVVWEERVFERWLLLHRYFDDWRDEWNPWHDLR